MRGIWTDGCTLDGSTGPGGWAAILVDGDRQKELSGGHPDTTNNRMELTAVIEALSRIGANSRPDVWSDSQYVVRGAMEWLADWKRLDWRKGRNKNSKAVKNVDLWKALDAQIERTGATLKWLRGHQGNALNERADALAAAAAYATEDEVAP
jgi:ribonuclease HI